MKAMKKMSHKKQHKFTRTILKQISFEYRKRGNNKSIKQLINLIAVEQDQEIMERFWQILHEKIPGHTYTEMYHCPGCDGISLE